MSDFETSPAIAAGSRKQRVFLLGASPSLTNGHLTSAKSAVDGVASDKKLQVTGQNTGNQVIAYGLLKTIEFESVSWDTSIGPERVNAEFDVVVVAAANFLHSGFDFKPMADFIEATKLPCVMIGVGAQSKDYSTDISLLPGTDRLMRIVAERSGLIGARGPFTAAVLARMGIHNVQVTGCPSYYMGAKPTLEIRKPALNSNSRLLVNSSRDVVSHSFDRERMVSIACAIIDIAIRRGADFVAQSELPEITIADSSDTTLIENNVKDILDRFPAYEKVASFKQLVNWFGSHMKVFWDVESWYDAMKNYDFVFGNRFHGAMVAIQAGTAACVIMP